MSYKNGDTMLDGNVYVRLTHFTRNSTDQLLAMLCDKQWVKKNKKHVKIVKSIVERRVKNKPIEYLIKNVKKLI